MTYVFKHVLALGFVLPLLVAACSAKVVPPIQPASQTPTQHGISASAPPSLTAADIEFVAAMLAP